MIFPKTLKRSFLTISIILVGVFLFFFVGSAPQPEEVTFGINFSQKQAEDLKLNWQEVYLSILDDLRFKKLKLLTHWNLLEPSRNTYNFNDLDWQINEAEKRGVRVILVVGMKTGRWPECHIPKWATNLTREEQQGEVLELVEKIITRYSNSSAIERWQTENEPFFAFGQCPWSDEEFVKKEINLIKSLDEKKRSIIVSDSGELSFWTKAARIGDILGITMYRRVWSGEFKKYFTIHLPAIYYYRKSKLIEKIFNKKTIVVELQAEPWPSEFLTKSSILEQRKTMTLVQFRKNVEFAKKTGFNEFYFWGAEWWYWVKKNFPEDDNALIWDEVKVHIQYD